MDTTIECKLCHVIPTATDHCSTQTLVVFGELYKQVVFGKEVGDLADSLEGLTSCPSCLVVVGKPHHMECENEACPFCLHPMTACGCHKLPRVVPLPP